MPAPADGVDVEDPRYRAAVLQHQLAKEAREYLSNRGQDVAWLASSQAGHPGVSVDRMHRMLRGETMMQIADVLLFTALTKDATAAVENAIGVDRAALKELEYDNYALNSWRRECTCVVGDRAEKQLARRRRN